MRISDWSSDVCSSDLQREVGRDHERSLARNGKFVGTRTVEEAAAAAAGGQHRNQASGEDQFTHQFSDSVFAPFSRSRSARASRISTPKVMAASRSEEHTSELQSLMRISYAVFRLKKKTT